MTAPGPGMHRNLRTRLGLAHDLARVLVVAQALERRCPQRALVRPARNSTSQTSSGSTQTSRRAPGRAAYFTCGSQPASNGLFAPQRLEQRGQAGELAWVKPVPTPPAKTSRCGRPRRSASSGVESQ